MNHGAPSYISFNYSLFTSSAGVCDPWNEGQCVNKNSWLDCSRDEVFSCEYINDPSEFAA